LNLQADYDTSSINVLLSGYGIETQNVQSVHSKRQYVLELLKTQPDETIIEIAKDLNFNVESLKEPLKKQVEKSSKDMIKKVFISHSSSDIDIVEKIIKPCFT
ncbi:MAG: hypothetical protein DRJ09_13235, partial [Bacteroidetes bacterium]